MEEGTGSPRVLIVGEAPGEHEDRLCRPFVGKSGELLRDALSTFLPDGVAPWITNAVKCRPPDNKKPPKEALKECHKYLLADIEAAKPDRIIVAGAIPLRQVLGIAGITSVRGRRLLWEFDGRNIPVYPVFHPAYVLRDMGMLEAWTKDLERAYGFGEEEEAQKIPYKETTLDNLIDMIEETKSFVFDVETNKRLNMMLPGGFITILGLGTFFGGVFYTAGIHMRPDGSYDKKELRKARELFLDNKILKIAHHIKFDLGWVRTHLGLDISAPLWDTMVGYYIGVSEELSSSLKSIAYLYTPYGGYEEELKKDPEYLALPEGHSLEEWNSTSKAFKAKHTHYNFMDLYVTWKSYENLKPIIDKDKGFRFIFYEVLIPAMRPFSRIEEYGAKIDIPLWGQFKLEAEKRMAKYHYEFWCEIVGAGVRGYDIWYDDENDVEGYIAPPKKPPRKGKWLNMGSPSQIGDILYRKLKLPVLNRTKNDNPSTDKETMEMLFNRENAPHRAVLDNLAKWRAVETCMKMFLRPMPNWLDDQGFVHPRYSLTFEAQEDYGAGKGTKTGRPAASFPNIQQLPRNIEEGTKHLDELRHEALKGLEVRKLYTSRFKGGAVISADYSQIELRWAAILSGDKAMLRAFNSGADIHRATAAEVYELPIDQITKEMRFQVKKVNFGILYGQSHYALADELHCTPDEAKSFIDNKYFGKFPGLRDWIDKVHRRVVRTGSVRTYFGRLRRLSGAHSSEKAIAEHALRQGVNCDPQADGSDMLVISAAKIDEQLEKRGMRSVLFGTIHDSLEIDSPPEEVRKVARLTQTIMEDWDDWEFPVPIVVDVEAGPSFGELEPIESYLRAQEPCKKGSNFNESGESGYTIPF
jgi:DNA polymerase-1